GVAGMALLGTRPPRTVDDGEEADGLRARAVRTLAASARGADEIVRGSRLTRALLDVGRRLRLAALVAAGRRPRRVLAIAAAVAAVGWIVDTRARVETDMTKLVPGDMPALRDLQQL